MPADDGRGSCADPPDKPPNPGGKGRSFEGPLRRSDVRLIDQALRNDWPIPPELKERLFRRLLNYVDPESEECQSAPDRTIVAAHRAILGYLKLSQGQQALDLARQKFEGKRAAFDLADLVAAAERRAIERKEQRDNES